jgi:hypothetical protein
VVACGPADVVLCWPEDPQPHMEAHSTKIKPAVLIDVQPCVVLTSELIFRRSRLVGVTIPACQIT